MKQLILQDNQVIDIMQITNLSTHNAIFAASECMRFRDVEDTRQYVCKSLQKCEIGTKNYKEDENARKRSVFRSPPILA